MHYSRMMKGMVSLRYKRLISLASIILIVLIFLNVLLNNPMGVFFRYATYSSKADIKKVADKFKFDIQDSNRIGNDYFFHGVEEMDNKEKYIFLTYVDRTYHEVYANEGISKEEAIAIALENGYVVNCSELLVWQSFTKYRSENGEEIQPHMYWLVFKDTYGEAVYINFVTGSIKVA